MKLFAEPSITSDVSDGFVLGGIYDKKRNKIIWLDYSKKINMGQQENLTSKVLIYAGLSSPFVIVPIIALIHSDTSITMEDILGGRLQFWIITVIFSILVSESLLFKLRNYPEQGELTPDVSVIIEKNIVTAHLDRTFKHNLASGGAVSSILSKVPYLQWLFIFSIIASFIWLSYQATNDLSANYVGKVLFYLILILLFVTLIIMLQLVFPMFMLLIKQEKKLEIDIQELTAEELQIEINKAEQFYKNHQVSNAAIKRYLAEYKKILKEKEMEIKK